MNAKILQIRLMQIALLFIAGFVVYIWYLVPTGSNIRTELPLN